MQGRPIVLIWRYLTSQNLQESTIEAVLQYLKRTEIGTRDQKAGELIPIIDNASTDEEILKALENMEANK